MFSIISLYICVYSLKSENDLNIQIEAINMCIHSIAKARISFWVGFWFKNLFYFRVGPQDNLSRLFHNVWLGRLGY